MVVADKARVEFKGVPDQRFYISNEVIWDTNTAEETFRYLALRAVECVDTNGRRSEMICGLDFSSGASTTTRVQNVM